MVAKSRLRRAKKRGCACGVLVREGICGNEVFLFFRDAAMGALGGCLGL